MTVIWFILADYRHELAGSPEKFFKILERIEGLGNQEWAVRVGVIRLLNAKRHDLVVPLVNTLGMGTFNGESLKEKAILTAFDGGTRRGNQDIVELYCEHPRSPLRNMLLDCINSWNDGEPNQVFQFLLEQADQGDLDMAKEKYAYAERYEKFRQAIDKAPRPVPPAGSRHHRPIERA